MFGQSLLSAFGSAVACTTDTDQLFTTDVQTTSLATYQLNNATTSIPSNTYPGTPTSITYAAGKFGNAAVFNGTSSYIDLGNSAPFGDRNDIKCISGWIKLNGTTSNTTDNAWLYSVTGSADAIKWFYIGYRPTQNTIQVYRRFDTSNTATTNATITPDTEWHHIVAQLTATEVEIYLDGNKLTTTNTNTGTGTNTTWIDYPNYAGTIESIIGKSRQVSPKYYDGKIDQVRIFNTALPQAAVTALYNETTTTATYDYVEYEGPNPNSVAYYKMSDATDQLGNYNGTATDVNFNTEGKFGFAGAFNGGASYLNLNSAVLPASVFSVSMWINLNSLSTGWLFSQYTGGVTGRFIFNVTSTGGFQINVSSTNSLSTTNIPVITTNNWHHVVVVKDGSNGWILYADGASHSTWNSTENIITNQNTILGGDDSVTSSNMVGKIDQIRIYDSAISAENVTALYEEIECPAVAVTNAFNTVIYTGNGGTQSITNVGFEPNLTWIKDRDTTGESHRLNDSVRGVGKPLYSNGTFVEGSEGATGLTAFNSNGFSIGNSTAYNNTSNNYVAWNWYAPTAETNNAGTNGASVTSTIKKNVDAGFSIVKYTGSGSGAVTVSHGLDVAPEMYIVKSLSTGNWWTYHKGLNGGVNPSHYFIRLDLPNAESFNASSGGSIFNSTEPTSTVFSGGATINTSNDFIAYAFHSVDGYSKIGSYTGTGATGNVQYLGFEPSFLMWKAAIRPSGGGSWYMYDNKRTTSNPQGQFLQANEPAAEADGSSIFNIDFNSNGFTINGTNNEVNQNGSTYIFLAIA